MRKGIPRFFGTALLMLPPVCAEANTRAEAVQFQALVNAPQRQCSKDHVGTTQNPFVQIGPLRLRIPMETQLRVEGSVIRTNAIYMRMLLPNLEFERDVNRSRFRLPGWQDKISILIQYPYPIRTGQEILDDLLTTPVVNGVPYPPQRLTSDLPGFQRWKTLASRELYIITNNDAEPQVFHCSEPDVPSRYCTYTAQLFPHAKIQYDFDINYLKNFESVRRNIYKLLDELLVCVDGGGLQ